MKILRNHRNKHMNTFLFEIQSPGSNQNGMQLEAKKKIPFLTSCIPNLGFDVLVIDEECPRLEFDTDRCLGIDTEFVP